MNVLGERSVIALSSEQILDALKRVLASDDFIASDRNRRFLSYVTEETLAGRAERLKGYTIAVQVFGRDGAFDAQADPLVRIEARHLRQSLERYYLTAGSGDRVRISIPKGGYVPVFESVMPGRPAIPPPAQAEANATPRPRAARRVGRTLGATLAAAGAAVAIIVAAAQLDEPETRSAAEATPVPLGPYILVQPFTNGGGNSTEGRFLAGLTDELTHALSRFKTIQVASTRQVEAMSGAAPHDASGKSQASSGYVLTGSLRSAAQTIRLVVQLEERGSGELIWTRVFNRQAASGNPLDTQSEIAADVASTLGDPYGVLFSNEIRKTRSQGSIESGPYPCALRFYVYWLNPTKTEHRSLRECHERYANSAPPLSGVWTNLAWLYLDEHRFDYNRADAADPPLERAAEAARQAVSLQPDSARAHLAAAVVQWFRKDFRSFDRHAELALLLNPNDATINAELGLRYGLRGDWERSRPLIDRAIARDPIRWQTYRVSYAQEAVETGDFETALEELRLTRLTDHPVIKVLRAAIYGNLGRIYEAREDWDAAAMEMPRLRDDALAWIDDRSPSPPLRRRILEGLGKAGLLEEQPAVDRSN